MRQLLLVLLGVTAVGLAVPSLPSQAPHSLPHCVSLSAGWSSFQCSGAGRPRTRLRCRYDAALHSRQETGLLTRSSCKSQMIWHAVTRKLCVAADVCPASLLSGYYPVITLLLLLPKKPSCKLCESSGPRRLLLLLLWGPKHRTFSLAPGQFLAAMTSR